MAVYIDTMNAKYGRMIMCHMLADSEEELNDMADIIGVNRKWIQYSGTYKVHYDICLAKKAKAMNAGAIEITQQQLARLLRNKKKLITV